MNKIKINKENKHIIMICIFIILAISIMITVIDFSKNNDSQIKDSEKVSNDISVVEETKSYEIKDLGMIECKKIELNAPIKETTELDVLATAVGHFEDTALYNGNVCLAGHNSGTNKNGEDIGFFRRLNELEIGDEIVYHHMFGQYIYKVSEIKEVEETDLSMLEPTSNDKLTLITCVKGQKKLRLCVVCDRV